MKTIEYTTIDRGEQGWPSGPWDGEPDKVQWPDPETGLPCLAVRHSTSGHWCGYVGVDESHPLHGEEYGAPDVDVHGGLTFSGSCQPSETESRGVCHVPSEGEPDHVWWFGFDCAHAWDLSPVAYRFSQERGGIWGIDPDSVYRDLNYVKAHCRMLAKQLKEAA